MRRPLYTLVPEFLSSTCQGGYYGYYQREYLIPKISSFASGKTNVQADYFLGSV
jgi:hypothetical protein